MAFKSSWADTGVKTVYVATNSLEEPMNLLETTRVVVADDHAVVRRLIRDLLNKNRDIQVVGEASNGQAALQLTRELEPDVLLLDVEMPIMNGVEVAQKLRDDNLPVAILILSAYDDKEYILEMLSTGVSGYLVKGEAPDRIIEAVRGAARQEKGWFSPQVASALDEGRTSPREHDTITRREIEILRAARGGGESLQIARQLNISEGMVDRHLHTILDKLGVGTLQDALDVGQSEGWL